MTIHDFLEFQKWLSFANIYKVYEHDFLAEHMKEKFENANNVFEFLCNCDGECVERLFEYWRCK